MPTLLGEHSEGRMLVVSAPAGTGKTTLVQRLVQEFPEVKASVSYTTRQPREGEIPGVHYHFISEAEFEVKIAEGDFLEYVKLYDTYYGTSRQWILAQQKKGYHIVLVIDTQGALQLKGRLAASFIFIRPPSLQVLQTRLVNRLTESPEMIEKRLEWAKRELEAVHYYDYQIINDDLEVAYQVLKSIVIAECHRVHQV
jgi:guanylate kinase